MIAILVIAALLLFTLLLAEHGWNNVLSPTRNDLVFEGRNRAYGAYPLRREHPRVLLIATAGAIGVVTAGLVIPQLFSHDAPPDMFKPPIVIEFDPERIYEAPDPVKKPVTAQPDPPSREREPDQIFDPVDSTVAPPDTTSRSRPIDPDTSSRTGDDRKNDHRPDGDSISMPDPGPTSWAQVMPEFPGGQEALQKWFANNIHFDAEWLNGKSSAQVFVEFVIDGEGRVASATLLKGVDKRLDNAVLRAIRGMPTWIPGSQGGRPVSVRFTQPVRFRVYP